MWEWNKNTPEDLARYALPQAVDILNPKVEQSYDTLRKPNGHYILAQQIYDALCKSRINYDHPANYTAVGGMSQSVRTPTEVKNYSRATCLDSTLLYCGICLHYNLLPVVIWLEDHALAAVSLTHTKQTLETIQPVWCNGPVGSQSPQFGTALSLLKDKARFVVVECTGFAYTGVFPAHDPNFPEGWSRTNGRQDFKDAVTAGLAQLANPRRPFNCAIHIAFSQQQRQYWAESDTTAPMNHAKDVTEGVKKLRFLEELYPGEIDPAVQNGRSNLEEVNRHISELNTYKKLHTQLHHLYFRCYNIIRTKLPAPDDMDDVDVVYDDVPDYAAKLEEIVTALQSIVQPYDSITALEVGWIAQIEQAYDEMICLTRIDASPHERLEKLLRVIGILSSITLKQPSRINDKLYNLLATLPLSRLRSAMLDVRNAINHIEDRGARPPADLVEPYDEGIRQLDGLADILGHLLTQHNIMQGVDTKLREFEDSLRYLHPDFAGEWQLVDDEAQKCYLYSQETKASHLRAAALKLKASFNKEPEKIAEIFLRYRSNAGHLFFVIDALLMEQCSKLDEVRQALSGLWL